MMNAAVFHNFGDPAKVIVVEQVEIPQPGDHDVLVRMVMSPIHNHDLVTVRGQYGVKPVLPAVGGSEGVGIVTALGAKVTGVQIGARVAAAGLKQGWAEYFVAPAASLVPIPDAMTDETAAQILGMPLSSVLALNQYDAQPGDWIIVNAGNGAVGKVIAAAGRARGVMVALLVRREQARADLMAQGFEHVFVDTDAGWQDRLREVIGTARVAGGVDNIGGPAAGELAALISADGLLLSFGAMSGQPVQISASDLIFKQITLRGYWSYVEFRKLTPAQMGAVIAEVFSLSLSGQLVLPVAGIFPLAEAASAMAASAVPRDGKVLIAG